MATVADPKFVPAAASLSKVGMKVSDIRTDDALVAFVLKGQENRALSEAQEAVAVYTARKRGHEFDWIISNLHIQKDTAERREIEGMALLRLQVSEHEVPRVQSAIRSGRLGIKVVDDITAQSYTQTDNGVDTRLEKLEILSGTKKIQEKYVLADKGQAISDKQAAEIVAHARKVVEAKVEPVSAASILAAIPNFSEEVGLKVRDPKRAAGQQKTGPMGLEFHLKAALKDIAALEKAAEEPYVLTTHDYKALFDVVSRFGLALEPTEALIHALDVAEKAGL
jgi:hypothetical protein